MLAIDELKVRRSEVRQRLNTISGLEGDALTPEVRDEAAALGIEMGAALLRRGLFRLFIGVCARG